MKLPTTPRTVFAVRPFAVRLLAPQRAAALLLALLAWCLPSRAFAHKNGEASEGCGCHSGGQTPTVMITPDLMTVNPGQLLTLTVSISQTNGPVAGFFLATSGVGTLKVVDSGTFLSGNGITHTTPRTGSGGFTTFKVGWMAPATPGGVDFSVWANSANGDGSTRGDGEGDAFFSTAFGCAGTKYYRDYDGDGVGTLTAGYTTACGVAPQYYAAKVGDCDDNDPKIYPGAPEICDGKDNNCDGQVDEGLPFALYCTDADGDGHGVTGKATMMACGASKGWGLCDNDCNDNDPTIYPGAPELCNGKDDNCNYQIDEGARTVCGVGWCSRYADGCGAAALSCIPGPPAAEVCNNYDDDCDGVADNGTDLELCKVPGLVCRSGYCIPAGSAGASGVGGSGSGSGAGPSSSGGVSAGGAPSSLPPGTSQAGNSAGPGTMTDPQAPPPGCSLGHSRTRAPLAGLGLLLAAGALLRRKKRRAAIARR
ncbi:MAG TPA: MopE-related protein [Polyangiaceae bacterium]